jgi:hypothetical protein
MSAVIADMLKIGWKHKENVDKKLSVTGQSLEEYFLRITGGDSNV